MRAIENNSTGRQRVVAELRELVARPYRDFIAWGTVHDVADEGEQERRRRNVSRSLADLSGRYLPRSMWLEPETRKKIEAFIERSGSLLESLSRDVQTRGYARARADIVRRVTRELGSARREAEVGLGSELSGPQEGRWQGRLRGRFRRLSGR